MSTIKHSYISDSYSSSYGFAISQISYIFEFWENSNKIVVTLISKGGVINQFITESSSIHGTSSSIS